MLLPVGPNVFDRIQFRGVAGEVSHPQTLALLGDEVAGNLAAVGRQPVPDDQQRSGNMTEQGLKAVDHLRAFHTALVKPEIEVVERERVSQWKLYCRTGVSPRGHQVRTRCGRWLIPLSSMKTIVRPSFLGFFLMAGHSTRRQRRMASSFR